MSGLEQTRHKVVPGFRHSASEACALRHTTAFRAVFAARRIRKTDAMKFHEAANRPH